MSKQQIVWQEASGVAQSIGTATELFKDCTVNFYANEGKRVTYVFTGTKGANKNKRAVVILSRQLMSAWEEGELDKTAILQLPIYLVTETPDGDPLVDENGKPLKLMVFGKPAGTTGFNMNDLDTEKLETYQPVTEHSFDDYLA